MKVPIDDLPQRQVLLAVEDARRRERQAQADTLLLAAHWCDLHGEVPFDIGCRTAGPRFRLSSSTYGWRARLRR